MGTALTYAAPTTTIAGSSAGFSVAAAPAISTVGGGFGAVGSAGGYGGGVVVGSGGS